MAMFRTTATLNNRGVLCFRSGHAQSALALFRQGLETVVVSLELAGRQKGLCGAAAMCNGRHKSQISETLKLLRDTLLHVDSRSDAVVSSTQVANAFIRPFNLIPLEGVYRLTVSFRTGFNNNELSSCSISLLVGACTRLTSTRSHRALSFRCILAKSGGEHYHDQLHSPL
jgi:hypothetical protein